MPLSVRGGWPGSMVMCRGFSRAEARPWNADLPDAQLRILRGGRVFLQACTDHLLGRGVPSVVSPPLQETAGRMWRATGYRPFLSLDMWRHDLGGDIPAAQHPIEPALPDDWPHLLSIDRAAFDPLWRLDGTGLREACRATPRSKVLVVRGEAGSPVGYAVIGVAASHAYLQRLAVDPSVQRGGRGRSLLRSALGWARSSGAAALLLNTQPDNHPAADLYASEGLRRLPARLRLLRTCP